MKSKNVRSRREWHLIPAGPQIPVACCKLRVANGVRAWNPASAQKRQIA